MRPLRIRTARLELIAASVEMARAERDDRARLEWAHGVRLAEPWPPPLNDEASLAWSISILEANPGSTGWGFWYFCLPGGPDAPPLAIGNGGFKGPPGADATVEIGYSILEAHQRRGYASEAVAALVHWAFDGPGVARVIAETYPELFASIAVLKKLGFTQVEGGSEEGAIRFERLR